MKRGWKIFWITCIIVAGTGLALCIAGWGMGATSEAIAARLPAGFGLGIISGDSYFGYVGNLDGDETRAVKVKDTREEFTGVRSIDMDVWAGEINIQTAEDTNQGIIVEAKDIDKRLQLRYYMEDGELKFKTKDKVFRIKNAGKVGKINIYIPKGYEFEEISLEVGAGALYVDDILARELSVDIGAGEAVINHFSVEQLDLECGAGEITACGEAGIEADIDCGVGEITYTAVGKETDYNYNIECGIGEVICGGSSYSGIASEKTIDNGAQREMNIKCGIGEVTVDFSHRCSE